MNLNEKNWPSRRVYPVFLGQLILKLTLVTSFVFVIFGCSPEKKEIRFVKQILTNDFVSEGVAVADVNKDGAMDILAGSFWFESPDWTRHELDSARVFEVTEGKKETIEESYSNSMLNFAMDVNLDGWVDFIRVDFPGTEAYWYENPKNQPGHWKRYLIFETVGNESPGIYDIDGDGRMDFLCGDSETNQMIWLKPPESAGDTIWKKFVIASDSVPGTLRFSHGLGVVDVNQNGKPDVIIPQGWWEPASSVTENEWSFVPAELGDACAQMVAYDIDQDGDQDIISSSAHKRGIWWYEQTGDGWRVHTVSTKYSQTHALGFRDLNEDGKPDIVTGKRYLASRGNGDGAHEPAVVLWIEFTQSPNPEWTIHEVDTDSGVGLNVVLEDVTGDGKVDIVSANKKGVFLFRQDAP